MKVEDLDKKLIYELARVHCTQAEIAAAVGCSIDTLQRHFKELMSEAQDKGKVSVKRKFFAKAESGNLSAMIFFLKTQCGWKERVVHEDPNGDPIEKKSLYPSMTRADALRMISEKKKLEEVAKEKQAEADVRPVA